MSDRRERLVQDLSSERIDPYLKACDGDLTAALRLYAINIELSAAFTGPLHVFEVTLRNALHTALASHFSAGQTGGITTESSYTGWRT